MNDLGTLCLLGIFVIVGFMLLSRFMGRGGGGGYGPGGYGPGGTDFSQRGPERPTIDNPEVRSRGSFGRPRSFMPRSLRRPQSGGPMSSGTRSTGGGRADNPEVKSRGSFGRGKK